MQYQSKKKKELIGMRCCICGMVIRKKEREDDLITVWNGREGHKSPKDCIKSLERRWGILNKKIKKRSD